MHLVRFQLGGSTRTEIVASVALLIVVLLGLGDSGFRAVEGFGGFGVSGSAASRPAAT